MAVSKKIKLAFSACQNQYTKFTTTVNSYCTKLFVFIVISTTKPFCDYIVSRSQTTFFFYILWTGRKIKVFLPFSTNQKPRIKSPKSEDFENKNCIGRSPDLFFRSKYKKEKRSGYTRLCCDISLNNSLKRITVFSI